MKRLIRAALLLTLLALPLLLTGCGGKEKSVPRADLPALYEQLKALPDAPEMVLISEKRMVNYYGIDPQVCPQALLARCSDGLRADEIWLVEAADEAAAKTIAERAEARIRQLCEETENYLPEQYLIVKQAKVVQVGNSVGLFISPQSDRMADMFRAAFA